MLLDTHFEADLLRQIGQFNVAWPSCGHTKSSDVSIERDVNTLHAHCSYLSAYYHIIVIDAMGSSSCFIFFKRAIILPLN